MDGLNEKVTVCERRMEKCHESAKENIESVVDSANKTMSVLVDKVGECKESVSLVINTVDECVKKVDGYETVAGICNERVSVCESHVRDCVRREKHGEVRENVAE